MVIDADSLRREGKEGEKRTPLAATFWLVMGASCRCCCKDVQSIKFLVEEFARHGEIS